jgi:hypothetical protein
VQAVGLGLVECLATRIVARPRPSKSAATSYEEDPLQPAFGEHRLTDGLAVDGDREAIVPRVTVVGAPVLSVAMCQSFLPGA